MQITIYGSGDVGSTLGRGLARGGHVLTYGVRDPTQSALRALLAESGDGASAVALNQAAASADVVILATPWQAVPSVLQAAGDLSGKIVIDATNPLQSGPAGLESAIAGDTSAAEQIAAWAPGARVVKAFNTVGFNIMASPAFAEGPATLLIAGDDEDAKRTVSRLASNLGFEPIDLGPLRAARLLEAMACIWIELAMFRGQGREIAFRLLRR